MRDLIERFVAWLRRLRFSVPAGRRMAHANLRSEVLHVDPATLRIPENQPWGHAWCVLMETGLRGGVASLIVVADGTVSFYTGTGGGTIGAGASLVAAGAADRFLEVAGDVAGRLDPAAGFLLPKVGHVRFQVRSGVGDGTADAPEDVLRRGRHLLSPLYFAGQDVLTEIRLLEEERKKD